ncbi:MAG: TIGR03545 family protein [Planctomycetota bacterium]
MIRWRFLLTRVIVVVAIIMIMIWGLGPMVGYVTVRGLQAATGAKAEVASTHVGLFPPVIRYRDVRIADPRDDKEYRDAMTADLIELAVDGDELLRRRWVIRQARIAGLQVGTQRSTSGHLEDQIVEPASSNDLSMLDRLIGSATDQITSQAESFGNDLETIRRSQEIRDRWQRDYETLVYQARDLEKQIRDIRDTASGIENPLRDWPELQQTLARANEVREKLLAVRAKMEAMPDAMRVDLKALQAAKDADLAKVDALVPGDLSESKNFGVDLVSQSVQRMIQDVRQYVESGRTLAGYTVVAPESDRIRGEDFDFWGQKSPEFLIRQCEVTGVLRANGKTYTLAGVVDNLTPEPELLENPTHARLQLEGPETLQVDYVRDRRDGVASDHITLHWPAMQASPIRLGESNPGKMAVAIAGGQREVWVQLSSQGDRLQGRMVSQQVGVQMRLDTPAAFPTSTAAQTLNQSLAAVDRIDIDAKFEGRWNDLDLNLDTNLDEVFRTAAEGAIAKQLEVSRQQLTAKVDRLHREQLLKLKEFMATQQNEANALLAKADQSIEEMSRRVYQEVGDADKYLGRLRSAFGSSLK